MAALPDTLFQPNTFLTLSGSAGLVWVIVNGVRVFTGFYRKWLILVVSILIVFAAGEVAQNPWSLRNILLLIGNSFLLALTASGAQEASSNVPPGGVKFQKGTRRYRWRDSWFHES